MRQRLRAAPHDVDTLAAGLVGEVLGDAVTGEDDDADGLGGEHPVIALEGSCLAELPVGLEDDWGTAFTSAHLAAMSSAPLWLPPCMRTMPGWRARALSRTAQMRSWS